MRSSRSGRGAYLKPYRVGAMILLALGVLVLLVELQSPSLVFWTGERVPGTNDGGIIYYTVDGENRTLNAPGEPPPRPFPVTVYADPDDSSRDQASKLARGLDAVLVLSPFVAAGALMALGLVRRRRLRLRTVRPADGPRPSRSSRSR